MMSHRHQRGQLAAGWREADGFLNHRAVVESQWFSFLVAVGLGVLLGGELCLVFG